MDKTTAAVVVSYEHYLNSEKARNFVYEKRKNASMILFNEDSSGLVDGDHMDWDVVITNNGNLNKSEFLVAALSALSNHSNVYPVIALDNSAWDDIYTEAGVLIVIHD